MRTESGDWYPYRDAWQALHAAYHDYVRCPYKSPAIWRDIRQGGLRPPSELTMDEWQAQAVLTLHSARDALGPLHRDVLDLRMLVPLDRKYVEIMRQLARRVAKFHVVPAFEAIPYPYRVDVIAEWGGLRRKKSDLCWARDLSVSVATLRRMRNGGQGHAGLLRHLHGLLDEAVDRVAPVLVAARMTPPPGEV